MLQTASSPTYGKGLASYGRLLYRHKGFRTLWLGELLNSAGGWFAYVATLRRVAELAPPEAQGRLLAAVLATHYVPGLFLFPLAGVLADRAPRELVLAGACGVGGVAAAALTLVRGPGDLGLMLALLVLQFSATTVYEPTRRSLTPSLVPSGEGLRLATTLDSVGWSIMSAAGASAGGAALGKWGYGVCYAIDAATYAAAGVAALSLRGQVVRGGGGNDGNGGDGGRGSGGSKPRVELARLMKARRSDPELDSRDGGVGEEEEEEGEGGGGPPPPPPPAPSHTTLVAAFASAAADVRDGLAYVTHPAHRPILALACVKAAGSAVWGAADLVNTYVSEQPAAQAAAAAAGTAWSALVGSSSPPPSADSLAASVLGAIFACVGVGCFIGPLLSNALIPAPARPPALMRGIAAAFACLAAGYVGIAAASTHLGGVLAATAVRAAGSSILWAYSTLLLQLAVPDALLGRVCALEQAAFVSGECVSALGAAWLFDVAKASVSGVCAAMACVAGGVTVAWFGYCLRLEAATSRGALGSGHGQQGAGRSSDDAEAAAG